MSMTSFLLLPLLFAQLPQKGNTIVPKEVQAAELKAAISQPQASTSTAAVMIIDPKSRCNDYLEAYQIIHKEKAVGSIQFHLKNGTSLTSISDIKAMANGTLLFFTLTTVHGTKYAIVPIEDIASISHL